MVIRVLHVIPSMQHGGGMSTVVMNYLRNIDHDDFVFDVVCHGPYDEDYKAEIERYGGTLTGFENIGLSNVLDTMTRVRQYFDAHGRYDVVHCHMANAAFIYLKIAKQRNVPLRVLHSHQDHYADSWQHAMRNVPIVAYGKRFANCYIACSKKAGDFLFGKKPYTVLQNSIPTEVYRFNGEVRAKWRNEYGFDDDDIVFANIGRLTLQKNQRFLLQAFAGLHTAEPKSKLVVAGDGELRKELQRYTRSLGIADDVIWFGNVSTIDEFYQGMDILLFPSLYEGLPMVLVEAQAAGVTSLVSDTITREAIVTDYAKMLPIDKGVEPWIEAGLKAVSDLASSDRTLGARRVRDAGFDINDTVRDLEDIYRQSIYN
ncbi:glycosyltransferase [Bifidobacterium pseudolongum subsp. globosum]|jgi:glycosyltransferase involved in cell wall biosynthesis|nr:glycosyltransferase [Bifidobacterium pseudolongum subsp. globosum]